RLRDQLVGDDRAPRPEARTVPGGKRELGDLLLVRADHRHELAVRRNRGFHAIFRWRCERATLYAELSRASCEPDLAEAVAIGSVAVLRVHDPAARERDRPDVSARVVIGVGPEPGLADRAAEGHRPDREKRVITELGLVVAHPERAAV